MAIITPLLKKNNLDPENLANFRPVSGLPFMSKLIEKALLKRLSTHLESSHLFVPFQSAYRSNHSTETALFRVFNDLVMTVDSGRAAVMALPDLSAAFDTVDHPTLLSRLEARFGVSGTALLWFRSYIANRSQVVSISGVIRPLLLFIFVSLKALFWALRGLYFTTRRCIASSDNMDYPLTILRTTLKFTLSLRYLRTDQKILER